MESGSDSDGSHVSATPPRASFPAPPQPVSAKTATPFSSTGRSKRVKCSTQSNPNPIQRPKRASPSKPSKQPDPPPFFPAPISDLPFQIRRSAGDVLQPTSVFDSIGTLPAGFFTRNRASFSKTQKVSLSFEEDRPSAVVEKTASLNRSCPNKGSKSKLPNLIRGDAPLAPVKLQRSSGEGNFVRLNLNRNFRKFAGKGKRNSGYSSKSRYFRRSKRKAGPEDQKTGVMEEEGLVFEETRGNERKGKTDCETELIEEAVMAVQEEASDENLLRLLKVVYGFDSFRVGQTEAIRTVLTGQSTMLILPTGAGKSLCYQIPAMVLSGVTLVVSPLVALMIDQLKQLPPAIHGGLLCSAQKPEEAEETLRQLVEGTIKVLFVSPERFLNADFLSVFSSIPVSLVVVDEAHCISEWSHNFRPSYMRLRASLFRAELNVNCVLAMTATATTMTLQSVMAALEISSTNVIQRANIRDNLKLSVSLSGNRMKNLLQLMESSAFVEAKSIIVYCKFQSETDVISRYLCDNSISSKSYHSGLPAKERYRVQNLFCTNKIRVVVATVAFGMGLDKRDIDAVIHYSLPESLEEYVQEIGRAGRDGRLSNCHLFLDDTTYYKLRSLAHSDGVDEYAVSQFVHQIFSTEKSSQGNICSLIKESASRKLDLKEEVMLTLLTHLELGEVTYLRLLPQLNVTCTLNFHKTSPTLLADKDEVVAGILKSCETEQGPYVFNIPTLANTLGVAATDLSNHLLDLKDEGEVSYELKDSAFCYTIVEVPSDFFALSASLTKWLSEIEKVKVRKLDTMYHAVASALGTCQRMHGCCGSQHTPCMEKKILDYFSGNDILDVPEKMRHDSRFLQADIKVRLLAIIPGLSSCSVVFLQSNSQLKFTPRAVARIMHGIGSPAYPSTIWSRTHFWGRYVQVDFEVIMDAARTELIKSAGKEAI